MGTTRKVNIDGKPYTPQEISSMDSKIKTDAEDYLGVLYPRSSQYLHILQTHSVRQQKMPVKLLVWT